MKTEQEIYTRSMDIAGEYEGKEINTFHVGYAYQTGFKEGYEEGVADGNGASTLPALIKRVRGIVKRANALRLHANFDLSFRYETATVVIYDLDINDKINDTVFRKESGYGKILSAEAILDEAEKFLDNFANEEESRLTKSVETLSKTLSDTKKALRKVQKANATKGEN